MSVKFQSLLSDYLLFSVSLCSSPFLLSCIFRISCHLLSFYLLLLVEEVDNMGKEVGLRIEFTAHLLSDSELH